MIRFLSVLALLLVLVAPASAQFGVRAAQRQGFRQGQRAAAFNAGFGFGARGFGRPVIVNQGFGFGSRAVFVSRANFGVRSFGAFGVGGCGSGIVTQDAFGNVFVH